MHHFKTIGELKLKLESGSAQFASKSAIFCPAWPYNLTDTLEKQWCTSSVNLNLSYSPGMRDLENWWMTLKNNRAPFLYYVKPCASSQCHGLIPIGVTVRKRSNRRFPVPCDLEIYAMTLKNNRVPLLYYIKLCSSFRRWIQTWVTDRKRSIRVKIVFLFCVTLEFDG